MTTVSVERRLCHHFLTLAPTWTGHYCPVYCLILVFVPLWNVSLILTSLLLLCSGANEWRPVLVSCADKPHNPMVNAGAIVISSLIKVKFKGFSGLEGYTKRCLLNAEIFFSTWYLPTKCTQKVFVMGAFNISLYTKHKTLLQPNYLSASHCLWHSFDHFSHIWIKCQPCYVREDDFSSHRCALKLLL